jgi:hypothetical protein
VKFRLTFQESWAKASMFQALKRPMADGSPMMAWAGRPTRMSATSFPVEP